MNTRISSKWLHRSTLATCLLVMTLGTAQAQTAATASDTASTTAAKSAGFSFPTAPVKVASATYPPTVQVAGKNLGLNGVGVRTKVIFKVYTIGLYTTTPTHNAADILNTPNQPKRLVLVAQRDIEPGDLGKMFTKAIQENVDKATFGKIMTPVMKMGEIFFNPANRMDRGDSLTIDYIPNVGTVITNKSGAQVGPAFKEPEFFPAMAAIWLGQKPVQEDLKDTLLGNVKK